MTVFEPCFLFSCGFVDMLNTLESKSRVYYSPSSVHVHVLVVLHGNKASGRWGFPDVVAQ